jgi:hypothetical protein
VVGPGPGSWGLVVGRVAARGFFRLRTYSPLRPARFFGARADASQVGPPLAGLFVRMRLRSDRLWPVYSCGCVSGRTASGGLFVRMRLRSDRLWRSIRADASQVGPPLAGLSVRMRLRSDRLWRS